MARNIFLRISIETENPDPDFYLPKIFPWMAERTKKLPNQSCRSGGDRPHINICTNIILLKSIDFKKIINRHPLALG